MKQIKTVEISYSTALLHRIKIYSPQGSVRCSRDEDVTGDTGDSCGVTGGCKYHPCVDIFSLHVLAQSEEQTALLFAQTA